MRTCAGPPEVLTAAPLPVPNILSHARIESIAANYTVSILSPKESPVGAGGFILGQPVVTPAEHITHRHPDRIVLVLMLRKLVQNDRQTQLAPLPDSSRTGASARMNVRLPSPYASEPGCHVLRQVRWEDCWSDARPKPSDRPALTAPERALLGLVVRTPNIGGPGNAA